MTLFLFQQNDGTRRCSHYAIPLLVLTFIRKKPTYLHT
jgi:hypothetical protein